MNFHNRYSLRGLSDKRLCVNELRFSWDSEIWSQKGALSQG